MTTLHRHLCAAALGGAISVLFWWGRPDWDAEMRLWRAIGDGSFALLVLTLALGPLSRHWPALGRALAWRRELGIWFAVLAIAHTLLVFDGWARWDWLRFLGYEFVDQLGRHARLEPGFGLSNVVGLVAVLLAGVLMLTSSDRATRWLGGTAWKWLHYGSYVVVHLVILHTAYFLFMHYTESFHRPVPDEPNWFRYPFLTVSAALLVLQMTAFAATVRRRRRRRGDA